MEFIKKHVVLLVVGVIVILWALVLYLSVTGIVSNADRRDRVKRDTPQAWVLLETAPVDTPLPFPATKLVQDAGSFWSHGPATSFRPYRTSLLAPPRQEAEPAKPPAAP